MAGDDITQSGVLTVGGTASFTTDVDDETIDLNDFANAITGLVTFTTQTAGGDTGHVWFDNGTTALSLNTSTVRGKMDVVNGNTIGQAGKLTVGGTGSFVTDLDDFAIDFDDFENDIAGSVTFTTQGTTNSDVLFDKLVRLDIQYIRSPNVVKDIVIIIKTIPAVLFGRGAY